MDQTILSAALLLVKHAVQDQRQQDNVHFHKESLDGC